MSSAPQAVYTHGHAESVLRSHRWRTAQNSAAYLLPHLRHDAHVLDVGSGPGTITADLAALLPDGRVTALEVSEEAVSLTREEVDRRGSEIAGRVTYAVGDVHALDFADGSFDVVHAHQVLQHVADPVLALREMRRVCRPGGLVAARDSDYSAFTWFPASRGLDRWLELYVSAARRNGGEPDAGRRLLSWARRAGFEEVVPGSSTWCFATPEDRAFWGGMWADRIVGSALARQLLADGVATSEELAEVADAWRGWVDVPDAWLSVLHGEVLCRVPA